MIITLQAARVNNGLSQREAAKLFEVSVDKYAALERDNSNMPYFLIQKIPEVYGVSPDDIFFGNKNEFIREKESQRELRMATNK